MSTIAATIETYEHRLMRAWMRDDARDLKALVDRQCLFMFVGRTNVILDRLSFVEAAGKGFVLSGYQMSEMLVRKHGPVAVLNAKFELDMRVRGEVWEGSFWITDIWKKSRIKRAYRLVDRSMARPDDSQAVTPAIRALQLWR